MSSPDGEDTLVTRFRDTAKRWGDRPAVVDHEGVVTYRELDEASRLLAQRLSHHCGPGDLMALSIGRNRHAMIAILAVLATGAGYVPVDPSYPPSRRQYLLEDSGARFVLRENACQPDGLEVVDNPGAGRSVTPVGTAYVIYTSGSTGVPKGCVIGHGNVLAMMDAALRQFQTGPDDVWSLCHSWSFDFSVWEMWGALLTGGCAKIVDRAAAADPYELLTLVQAGEVTVLCQVPSAFSRLVAEAVSSGRTLETLRLIIFGGEPIIPTDIDWWWSAEVASSAVLVNMYGITETTVHVTHCELTPDVIAAANGDTPIGVPLPHLRVELRDENGAAVPAGVPGEMWVSGAGVSSGYLGRPELTTARFVCDATEPERVHYRSGDWAVADDRGSLHYRGRFDGQVKVRGFRIELGEVESAVRSCPGVIAAGCSVEQGSADDPSMLSVYVVAGVDGPTAPQLRVHLAHTLPGHMLPQCVHFIDALPLTHNGKLDRQALPRLAVR